ncbi:carbohydrate kinase [Marinobacter qingdaonensis]|uniref:Carbohydrate kinase n=1 Tax=Marinobacter qingdaonensis TaxID=3108486 RepID=A0ABU5P210_9GAMM|nr:carbohydrate kinase [Marinobacter sp. ASW11-75]MEA1082075.1 carbohydrate kinase [Marinobacter sp. ASW11-75]
MLKVISFGEALIDMLSNRISDSQGAVDQPSDTESFTKYPGGAPANVAAAVAKLGGNSYFAGKVGADMFGDFLVQSLEDLNVQTDYLVQTQEAKTALAFVSLDSTGERSFEFYRGPSADLLFRPDDFKPDWFQGPGIFHFCSNTLTEPGILEATHAGVEIARSAGWLVSFDANLRANLWPQGADPYESVWHCVQQADLVKLSAEELDFLCRGQDEPEVIGRILAGRAVLVLVTDGGKPLRYFTAEGAGTIAPKTVTMVDSTAAGDAFVGGLLFRLSQLDITGARLGELAQDTRQLEGVLSFASACGAHAVTRAGAFTSLPALTDISGEH